MEDLIVSMSNISLYNGWGCNVISQIVCQDSLQKKDTPAVKLNKDRLVAAKTALQDNTAEFLGQTLTRLITSGKCNDSVVQRVRKAFESFDEFNKLCVEAENQVINI